MSTNPSFNQTAHTPPHQVKPIRRGDISPRWPALARQTCAVDFTYALLFALMRFLFSLTTSTTSFGVRRASLISQICTYRSTEGGVVERAMGLRSPHVAMHGVQAAPVGDAQESRQIVGRSR